MTRKNLDLDKSRMLEGDERLSAVLHEWKGLEPLAGFEADVWRRIRADAVPEPRRSIIRVAQEWFTAGPVWLKAAAAGILIGAGVAYFTPAPRGGHEADEPLLHSRTLAGSYLRMTTGGTR